MSKAEKRKLQETYGNCISVEIRLFDQVLFDVCLEPLESDKREAFIKDVRALLGKYFDGNYYDFELSDDEQ